MTQLPAYESSLFLVLSFKFPQLVEEMEGTIESMTVQLFFEDIRIDEHLAYSGATYPNSKVQRAKHLGYETSCALNVRFKMRA